MTKVLFISPYGEDYLADGLLHGLRSLLKENVVDFPKCAHLYKNYVQESKVKLYGNGFTLYGLLEDIPVDRTEIDFKIRNGFFDLIIFPAIFKNFGLFIEFLPYLNFRNTAIIDGDDTPQPYGYAGKWWREPKWWFLPKAHQQFLYFKREWTLETIRHFWFKLPPVFICKYLPTPRNFRTISFSIPEEKIVKHLPQKTKLFPKHIVDVEVAKRIPGSTTSYAFESEAEYYSDLQTSKFGITTKRSGWDCLRHYEIAANGCVPCFRNLDKKPKTCAPHGLNRNNSIIYQNYDDLMRQIDNISEEEYSRLRLAALAWVRENTTIQRAKNLLQIFKLDV